MSKYTFTSGKGLDDDVELITTQTTIQAEVCEDVARQFYYFLLGVGYSPKTVVAALDAVANEVTNEYRNINVNG